LEKTAERWRRLQSETAKGNGFNYGEWNPKLLGRRRQDQAAALL